MYSVNPFNLSNQVFAPRLPVIKQERPPSAGGVLALCGLSKGLCSRVMDVSDVVKSDGEQVEKIFVKVSDQDLTLVPASESYPSCWVRSVQLAKDVHSYNVILEKLEPNKLVVRTIQSVKESEELVLWFAKDLQAELGIPFLTPTNIQDQNHYVCHQCRQIFENPNPLKIHVATACDRLSPDHWWARLLPPPTAISPTLSHPVIQPWTSHERVSAFRPVTSISPQSIIASPVPPASYMSPTDHHSILQAAARLETIVSNMGTSKQGHVCIYCGKLYSRKYGLKIHIRTHTGFKPLKCKFCYRPFGDPSNLNKHVRLHVQSNSIYKCSLCNKILVRRRDLQRHLQTRHSGVGAGSEIIKAVQQHLPSITSSSSSDDEEHNRLGYLAS